MKLTGQQRTLINDVIERLKRAIDHREPQSFIDDLEREEYRNERQHRNWLSERKYPREFGPVIAGRLFVAQHILGFVFDDVPLPTLADTLRLKDTYVKAAAIAAAFPDVIREQVTAEEAAIIRALDYVKLVEVEAAA